MAFHGCLCIVFHKGIITVAVVLLLLVIIAAIVVVVVIVKRKQSGYRGKSFMGVKKFAHVTSS